MTRQVQSQVYNFFPLVVTVVTIALLALFGCSSSSEFRPGTYTLTGVDEIVDGNVIIGDFEITFTEDQRYIWSKPITAERGAGDLIDEGSYEVTQDQIVFKTDHNLNQYCPDAEGKYQWSLNEKELTLTLVEDTCTHRWSTFIAKPWTREN